MENDTMVRTERCTLWFTVPYSRREKDYDEWVRQCGRREQAPGNLGHHLFHTDGKNRPLAHGVPVKNQVSRIIGSNRRSGRD